jgi:hypothetical protein
MTSWKGSLCLMDGFARAAACIQSKVQAGVLYVMMVFQKMINNASVRS